MTTERQKNAVWFCEQWLDERFEGDIDDFNDVSEYLSRNLDAAKEISNEAFARKNSNWN